MQMSTKREFTHNLLYTFPSAKITLYFQPPNKKETKRGRVKIGTSSFFLFCIEAFR